MLQEGDGFVWLKISHNLGKKTVSFDGDGFALRWKNTFQCVRMRFRPENAGNLSSSRQKNRSFLQDLSGSKFPLLHVPSYRKSRSALFRCNWVKYDYNPQSHRKQQLWIDLGESSDSFWGEEDQFSDIFGAKAHANVLKGAFSTDCKSNCVKNGLTPKL